MAKIELDQSMGQIGHVDDQEQPGWDLTTIANQTLDRILRINRAEVLNPDPDISFEENPARALMESANQIRAEVVDPDGKQVDYQKLAVSSSFARFEQIKRSLPGFHPETIENPDHRCAFWINLYNVLIIDAILHYRIQVSLSSNLSLFRRAAYRVGGQRFSADEIENGVLRGNRRNPYIPFLPFGKNDLRLPQIFKDPDPRIHFALVCGARACPPIAFYDGEHLDQQLDMAAGSFINGDGIRYDRISNTLWLSKIFRWYLKDFGGQAALLTFIAAHSTDEVVISAIKTNRLTLRWMKYDWTVNRLD
jgi:hypothetical protein